MHMRSLFRFTLLLGALNLALGVGCTAETTPTGDVDDASDATTPDVETTEPDADEGDAETVDPGCEVHSDCEAAGEGFVCSAQGACVDPLSEDCRSVITRDGAFTLTDNTLLIGGMFPLSATPGVVDYRADAATLALGQVNAAGGLVGNREVAMIMCDTTESEVAGVDVPQRVIEHLSQTVGVPLIIGPSYSGVTRAIHATANAAETVLISPSATAPSLSLIDEAANPDRDIFWRVVPSDIEQARGLAALIVNQGWENVLIFYKEDTYGQELYEIVSTELRDVGGVRFSPEGYDASADPNALRPQVSNRANSSVSDPFDAVLFLSTSEAADMAILFERRLNEYLAENPGALERPTYVFSEGGKDELLRQLNEGSELQPDGARVMATRVRGTQPDTRNPLNDYNVFSQFSALYQDIYGVPPALYASSTYDAVYVAYLAMCTIPLNEPITHEGLITGLRQLTSGEVWSPRGLSEEKNARCVALNGGGSIDLEGVSNSLNFNINGDVPPSGYSLWGIEGFDPGGGELMFRFTNQLAIYKDGAWTFAGP